MLPTPGTRFAVHGRDDTLTVARLLLAVSAEGEPTRYLVETKHGARWTVIEGADGWIGFPLPADPNAAREFMRWVDREL